MKRVTILALHLGFGGVEKSIASICNILANKYDVEVISVYKLYEKPAFFIDDRVKITYLLHSELSPNKEQLKNAIKSKRILNLFKEGIKSIKILTLKKLKMIEAIKNIKSGIVISTRIEHNKLLSRYGNNNVIKIAQEHTYHNEDKKYINNLVKSCKNIDYFIPVSKFLTDFYSKYFKETKTQCLFIPHSLDYIPDNVSNLDSNNIVSIGRLSPEKGFIDLVDVFKIVNEKYGNWKLNIIGDGTEKEKIKDKINIYGLQENILLHGYRDKEYINKQLENSSIYTMASYEESFGLVLIEAQSHGIPCIAFDSAKGAVEIIQNQKSGYLIKNRDKQQMADKIIELIENKELREKMGKESRINSYKYSKESISKKWLEFLATIDN